MVDPTSAVHKPRDFVEPPPLLDTAESNARKMEETMEEEDYDDIGPCGCLEAGCTRCGCLDEDADDGVPECESNQVRAR